MFLSLSANVSTSQMHALDEILVKLMILTEQIELHLFSTIVIIISLHNLQPTIITCCVVEPLLLLMLYKCPSLILFLNITNIAFTERTYWTAQVTLNDSLGQKLSQAPLLRNLASSYIIYYIILYRTAISDYNIHPYTFTELISDIYIYQYNRIFTISVSCASISLYLFQGNLFYYDESINLSLILPGQ